MSIEFSVTWRRGSFILDAKAKVSNRSVTAVIGPSGSGKTSLIRCIAGLEKDVRGRIVANKQIWLDSAEGAFLSPHRRKIGFVFQHAALFSHLSVAENLEYAAKRSSGSWMLDHPEIVELTGLEPIINRDVRSLSGGERQRVALGRALSSHPDFLFLDEPLSALDLRSRRDLIGRLDNILSAAAIPAILVSHNLSEAARLADQAIVMKDGRIEKSGDALEVVADSFDAAEDGREPVSVFEAKILSHDTESHLTRLNSPIGLITTPRRSESVGSKASIAIWAKDVSIALQCPENTSILNTFSGTIRSVEDFDSCRVIVTMDCEGSPLRALITRKSAEHLNLRTHLNIFALVKSVSIDS